MPTLQFATLAHGAQEVNGLISMLSGFIEGIQGPQYPVGQLLWFVGRIRLGTDEMGKPIIVVVKVEHPDGEQIARVEAQAIARGPLEADPDLPVGLNIVFPLSLEFRRGGTYQVVVMANGEEIGRVPLKVAAQLPSV